MLSKTRKCVSDIIRVCFFEAGRSIAHKCARFLALCIRSVLIIDVYLFLYIYILYLFGEFTCSLNFMYVLLFHTEFIKQQDLEDLLLRKNVLEYNCKEHESFFPLHFLAEMSCFVLT